MKHITKSLLFLFFISWSACSPVTSITPPEEIAVVHKKGWFTTKRKRLLALTTMALISFIWCVKKSQNDNEEDPDNDNQKNQDNDNQKDQDYNEEDPDLEPLTVPPFPENPQGFMNLLCNAWKKETTVLNLFHNSLQGVIPHEISNLTKLISLDLSDNNLEGVIPPQIGNLTSLIIIFLENNNLQGVIPSEISNLTELKILNLSDNNLQGVIPSKISNLTKLKILNLSHNNLQGVIPSEISNLTELTRLDLSHNNLGGNKDRNEDSYENLLEKDLEELINALKSLSPGCSIYLKENFFSDHDRNKIKEAFQEIGRETVL